MEEKIILVFKGILLYTTIIISALFLAGVDSIYDKGYFIPVVLVIAILFYACIKTINEKDKDILLFKKYMEKWELEI